MAYNGYSVYNEIDLSKDLNDYEDVTDKFTLEPGWIYKGGSILYNKKTQWLYFNYRCYKNSQIPTTFEHAIKFQDGVFRYGAEFTSPFCQSLDSSGLSNDGIAQYGFDLSSASMYVNVRKIYGNVYGASIRGLMYFEML